MKRLFELNEKIGREPNFRRAFYELRFAAILNARNENRYDPVIQEAADTIVRAAQNQGGLTAEDTARVEQILEPLTPLAKSYKVHCVAHSHLDMNWMWAFDETVSAAVDTFKTMLDIMNEYPQFTFSQSQASVYRIMEQFAPDLFEQIKKRVQEGRWEVTASTWVEPDKNLPTAESFARHILYTKAYFAEKFGIDPDDLCLDFEPDSFGHTQNIPEILSKGGVKYYYHCRGNDDASYSLSRWQSPSGAEVIVYREPTWYSSTIDYDYLLDVADISDHVKSKNVLKVYGVGNHGGGPTRRDIEMILELDSLPIAPSFHFSTYREYFKKAEEIKNTMPLITRELNFLCDGCYTSQSRIKEAVRKSEELLNEAESLSSFAHISGTRAYQQEHFSKAWEKTLFNQFHDILPGSGVIDTREHARGQYQEIRACADTERKLSAYSICDAIDTDSLIAAPESRLCCGEGAGVGSGFCGHNAGRERLYHLFNTSADTRTRTAEITLWDYEGDIHAVVFADSCQNPIPFQFLEEGGYWGHRFAKYLLLVSIPPFGYKTVTLKEQKDYSDRWQYRPGGMRVQNAEEYTLENEKIRAVFDPQNAAVISLTDKQTGKELIDSARGGAFFRLMDEADIKQITNYNASMSAWFIGRYKNIESVHQNVDIVPGTTGKIRQELVLTMKFRHSHLTCKVRLDADSSHLDFVTDIDWREFAVPGDMIPSIGFYAPLSYSCDRYRYDSAMGHTDRKPKNIDTPANSFAEALSEDGSSLSIITRSKYGFRCYDNALGVNLIRSSCNPDPVPEIGLHHIEFCLAVSRKDASVRELLDTAYSYKHEFAVYTGKKHPGRLSPDYSYLTVESDNLAVSALKKAHREEDLILRVYETEGKETTAAIRLSFEAVSACLTDLTELKDLGEVQITDGLLTFPVRPYSLNNIRIRTK